MDGFACVESAAQAQLSIYGSASCDEYARGLGAATAVCGLMIAGPALAGGSGMPWEGPLQQIVDSVTGPVVQAAAVIAVVLFGAGVAMSEGGSSRGGASASSSASPSPSRLTFFLDFFGFAGGAVG